MCLSASSAMAASLNKNNNSNKDNTELHTTNWNAITWMHQFITRKGWNYDTEYLFPDAYGNMRSIPQMRCRFIKFEDIKKYINELRYILPLVIYIGPLDSTQTVFDGYSTVSMSVNFFCHDAYEDARKKVWSGNDFAKYWRGQGVRYIFKPYSKSTLESTNSTPGGYAPNSYKNNMPCLVWRINDKLQTSTELTYGSAYAEGEFFWSPHGNVCKSFFLFIFTS